jgi:prepilin-type N-terminal cleavage/methylation domain-containing protein
MRTGDGGAGFTLIETLVALVIFVASYLLIHQSVSLGWRGVQVAQTEAAALRLAQARLAAAGVDTRLQEGKHTGETPDGYSWSTEVQRRDPPATDGKASRLAGYWVTVEVSWREGPLRTARSVQLTTLKLGVVP